MNNKNNIMSIISKKISIDNRNKTITKPFVLEHKTIVVFNSQYSTYENEVRFIDCIFEENVVLGDELKDEAFSVLETDLIFKNCIFQKKVILDGIRCKGHIVFDNCKFEDVCASGDNVLSITNAEIGIGIGIIRCILHGGINFSATTIKSIGCQIFETVIDNNECTINFTKAYFGRELSINRSTIICNNINFENTALDTLQGSIQVGGNSFVYMVEPEVLSKKIIKYTYNEDIEDAINIYSFFEFVLKDKAYLVIAKEDGCPFDNNNIIIEKVKSTYSDKGYVNVFIRNKNEIDTDNLTPIGNVVIGIKEDLLYYTIFANKQFHVYKSLESEDKIIGMDIYAKYIFDSIADKNISFQFDSSDHKATFMIRATLNEEKYIAIYDSNNQFKVYRWNFIQSNTPLVLSQAKVGLGLYCRQCEFVCPALDIRGIHSSDVIFFEDVRLETGNVIASEIVVPNFILRNVDYIIANNSVTGFWINNEDDFNSHIKLNNSKIANKLEIVDFLAHNQSEKEKFIIDLDFTVIDNVFTLEYNGGYNSAIMVIKTNNSIIHNLDLRSWNWDLIEFELTNCKFNTLRVDKTQASSVRSDSIFWKEMKSNIVSSIKEGNILFLKTVENIFYKSDNSDWIKVWKYRNNLRIKAEHPKTYWLHILWNRFFVNYGLHPWYLIVWLMITVILFDTFVWWKYNLSPQFVLINGFVEFLPVSFNSPIMEQLRDTQLETGHTIKETLKVFSYSSLVTAYRIISYILFSVIVAAFSGYFKGKNE